MELMKTAPRSSTRLNRGNVLLANARVVNTKPVKMRFDAFVDVHRQYIEAHTKVDEAEGLERAERMQIEQIDGALDKALAALSAALLLDGESLRNLFARFADRGPGRISALPFAEKAKASHHLVATLRRSMGVSEATLQAANRVEAVALQVEQALPGWELRRAFLSMARQTRDSLATQWDAAYSALRHSTIAVIETRDLYNNLFAQLRRTPRKTKEAEAATPATQVTPDATHAPNEPPASNPTAAYSG